MSATLRDLFTDTTKSLWPEIIEPDPDLLRILIAKLNRNIGHGPAFDMGEFPYYSDIKNIWPLEALGHKYTYKNELIGLAYGAEPDDLPHKIIGDMFIRLCAEIPFSAIKDIYFECVRDVWLAQGEARPYWEPHTDAAANNDRTTFGLISAFPLPTVTYPNVPERETETFNDGKLVIERLKSEERPFIPGHFYLFNEKSLVHRAPFNDKSAAEWREILKDVEGADAFIKTENGIDYIRSIFMHGIVEFHPSWLQDVKTVRGLTPEIY